MRFLKCQKLANCWEKWLSFGRSLKRFWMAIGKPSFPSPRGEDGVFSDLALLHFLQMSLEFPCNIELFQLSWVRVAIKSSTHKKAWKHHLKNASYQKTTTSPNFCTKERCALTPVTGSHSVALSGQNIHQEAPAALLPNPKLGHFKGTHECCEPCFSWLFLYLKCVLEAKIILMHFSCSPFTRSGVAKTVEQPLSCYPFYLAEYTKIYSSWYDWNSWKDDMISIQ